MKNLAKFSVKKPVTIIMIVLLAMIMGVVSFSNLTTDLFPSMNIPYSVVYTTYYGASPEEVETMVTKPLEASLASVSNIKEIQSISQDNASIIILQFEEDTNMDLILLDVRENIDMVTGYLPDGVNNPIIMKLDPSMMPVMVFSLSKEGEDISQTTLWYEDKVLPRLERIPGVASVSLSGGAQSEVQIQIDDAKLAAANQRISDLEAMLASMGQTVDLPEVTSDMVSNILKAQNFSMPGGYINIEGVDYLVKVGDKIDGIDGIKDTTIYTLPYPGFVPIKVSDVADVNLVNANDKTYNKVNGEDAISITIQKQSNYATTEVVDAVNKELKSIAADYDGVETTILMDQGEYITSSVNSVTYNLLFGAILAIAVLFVFLRNFKVTLTIAIAIPVSVIATFIMIYFSGITLNIISMGGLALGVGMLVDNAIVVLENIYRLRNEGMSAKKAAIEGTKEVAGAITASTLTTISVFLPIVFMSGMIAEVFKEMALTITFSLLGSLLVAVTLVPVISSKLLVKNNNQKQGKGIERIRNIYEKAARFVLRNRVATLITLLVMFGLSVFGTLRMGFVYFPQSDEGQFSVNIDFPNEYTFDQKVTAMDNVYDILDSIDSVDTIGASLGSSFFMSGPFGGGGGDGTFNVTLNNNRSQTTTEIAQEVRDETAGLDYSVTVAEQNMNFLGTTGVEVQIKGIDLDQLQVLANQVADKISNIEGTTEVDNGIQLTSEEIKITVNKDLAVANGLSVVQVFAALSADLNQSTITTINLDGSDVNVKLADDKTWTMDDLENYELTTPYNTTVKLKDIATISDNEMGLSTINHLDQSRVITVTAKVEDGYNVGKITQEIKDELSGISLQSGYSIDVQGEGQEFLDAAVVLVEALALAVVLVYMVMAAQFQSYKFPFIVMFTIPLAFTGGFLALLIAGMPLSVVALIGMVILSGIVVNNGIVFVDYTNQLRARGLNTTEALVLAGRTRLRPIFMTALTTILALSTLALGFGENSEMMQPMAVTAIGGLLFATLLTLLIIPVLYSLLDKDKHHIDETESDEEGN